MTRHGLAGLPSKNLPLYVFKLREVGVINKIITAKIITEPKSKKRKKVNDSILQRMFLWDRNSLYTEKKIEAQNSYTLITEGRIHTEVF